MPQKKYLTLNEAVTKLARYCAYQKRSQQEVRDKLYSLGLHSDDVEEAIGQLITEDFINEERFTRAYVGGKFRVKKWGRVKILDGLRHHRISDYCIKKGFEEIDPVDYEKTLKILIEKKTATLKDEDAFVKKQKVARYAISRGFEADLVWEIINNPD